MFKSNTYLIGINFIELLVIEKSNGATQFMMRMIYRCEYSSEKHNITCFSQ